MTDPTDDNRWANDFGREAAVTLGKTTPIRPGTARRLGLRRGVQRRIYTLEQEPPLGERVRLVNGYGAVVVWTGKRWYDPDDSNGSLQTQEAWPPDPYVYGSSVWREVS